MKMTVGEALMRVMFRDGEEEDDGDEEVDDVTVKIFFF